MNSWIDDGVRDISIKTFCYTLLGTAFTTTSGTSAYDFPSTINTSNISTVAIKTIIDSSNISLEYVTPDLMGRVGTGNAIKFTCWQQKMIFIPTPTAALSYTPYLVCVARCTAAGSLAIPTAYHHIVPLYVAAMGKEKRREYDAATQLWSAYNAEISRILESITMVYAPWDDRDRIKEQSPTD
jgi:hypothetical protein